MNFHGNTVFFGGSFDPIHLGHLHIAHEALRAIQGNAKLIFIPAAKSPGKSAPVASPEQRQEWIAASIKNTAFEMWDIELKRPSPSFTVDTLEEARSLGATPNQSYWLMGADAYANFPHWKQPERIRELCRIIVMSRPGSQIQLLDPKDILIKITPHPASSTAIRAALAQGELPQNALPAPVEESLKNLILLSKNPYARK